MRTIYNIITILMTVITAASCSQQDENTEPAADKEMRMTFAVTHPSATRATEYGFESGDMIGLYVCNAGAALEPGGNFVTNEALTYNGTSWAAARTLYWDAGTYNAYAYYPYSRTVTSTEDYPFNIQTDQRAGGYEASDFLYACTKGIRASAAPVPLTFRHIMSKLTVRLVKGEDFEGEMPTDADIKIHNTVTEAVIDLSAGVATRYNKGNSKTITAHNNGNYLYSAIIIPQRIANRMPLIEVEMNGVSYLFESAFLFKPGVEHLVNLVITDNPDKVKIEVGGEIQDWR